MSLACISFRAYSKEDFRFASVIARTCFATSVIGPGATATDLLAESKNVETAFSAWSTLFLANSRTCGGTSIVNFGSIMAAFSGWLIMLEHCSHPAASAMATGLRRRGHRQPMAKIG